MKYQRREVLRGFLDGTAQPPPRPEMKPQMNADERRSICLHPRSSAFICGSNHFCGITLTSSKSTVPVALKIANWMYIVFAPCGTSTVTVRSTHGESVFTEGTGGQ